ncbi:CATL-like protein [Mya arenaria]|uniref:CATL-like protein n=1 Tax=Mya arenaria TaxID=6604 RepID=A0ABY7E7J0_MYAAR|nr:CATL-like protein [Mya arenaria]
MYFENFISCQKAYSTMDLKRLWCHHSRVTTLMVFAVLCPCLAADEGYGLADVQGWKSFKLQFSIWKDNLQLIFMHNEKADQGAHSFWLKPNHFADMTDDEFTNSMLGLSTEIKFNLTSLASSQGQLGSLPDEIDWRSKNYVTPVKNQRHCGSCYSFSATGALEGQHFRKTGKLVSLSEQNIIDCTYHNKYKNNGCHGGLMDRAFQYVIDNGGIDTDASYPYQAEVHNCRFNKSTIGARAYGYHDIRPRGSEEALQQAVARVGPVSVGIDAHNMFFKYYSHGVFEFQFCSSRHLNHGVLVVGYGTDSGQDYWLVKNSWSMAWGMKGYAKMARNRNNMCGIASLASYPLV